ncbi:MAG: hypothetical protein IAE78_29145, partial [Myxococcus sp.]|nr:hypothetical protein [Myxococcus sp.]
MIRVSAGVIAFTALVLSCGPTVPVKCQPSNCSGCCTETEECIGTNKQTRNGCGSGGATCKACLVDQTCSVQGRCVIDPDGGVSAGGGTAGTGGGSAGGTTVCGGEGEVCCANQGCNLTLSCSRGLCIRCGMTNQPCCNSSCLGSNVCTNGTCVFPMSTGGGSAGGGSAGGGSAGGGSAGGGS